MKIVKTICILTFCFFSFHLNAQNKIKVDYSKSIPKIDSLEILIYCDAPPHFPGGERELQFYIEDNLEYDDEPFYKGIEGKVHTSFIVHKDGTITNIRVIKGLHPILDEAAVKLIMEMPPWIPGKLDGEPVTINHFMQVKFKIVKKKLDSKFY